MRTPFVWRDAASNSSVIADIHPGGYGGVTGGHDPGGPPYFSRDGPPGSPTQTLGFAARALHAMGNAWFVLSRR